MSRVSDVMTRGVRTLAPTDSVVQAAQAMDELNVGVIPVCDGDRLLGMVTDRDIVVRGVAQGGDLNNCKLSDVMSGHVRTVREGDDVDDVLAEMASSQIRRMPVVDAKDRLVGIVSLGDIAAKGGDDESEIGMSLGDISEPARPDRAEEPGTGAKKARKQPG
ncbi:CBS domain-containing protein [Ramlibacter sp. AW1]|uniref:CBS domain-containing protein n=1 Tax=Ramlibacter aurantiacus TaxID=2801330 RepID=A0A936ZNY5_9BURK|nr:CBS domain-containing protein [Ramlibacter aurantiacus]MBL0423242.1 CBS domain-containing protein [Ramlibacter aurantiacus]